MALYGIDVHPQFQAGLNIEQVRAEGFDFIAVKVSQGTNTYGGQDWLRRARACGLLPIAYHYLDPGNEVEQAHIFAEQLLQADVPGMLDAEALADDGKTPTLTVSGIRQFLTSVISRGGRVPLLYLPCWYWERMRSPDLTGMPRLWASSYVGGRGYAADLYETVTPRYWAPYGGMPVTILQFTDQASVNGQHIDADAFLGTRDELTAILGANPLPPPPPSLPSELSSIPAMEYGQTSDIIAKLQTFLNQGFQLYSHISPVTGYYGDQTTAVIAEFQRRSGIVGGDGRNCGDQTRTALWSAGFRP
jgi:lysozyme